MIPIIVYNVAGLGMMLDRNTTIGELYNHLNNSWSAVRLAVQQADLELLQRNDNGNKDKK